MNRLKIQASDVQKLWFGCADTSLRYVKADGQIWFAVVDLGRCLLPYSMVNIKAIIHRIVPLKECFVTVDVESAKPLLLLNMVGTRILMENPDIHNFNEFRMLMNANASKFEAMESKLTFKQEAEAPLEGISEANKTDASSSETKMVLWTSRQLNGISFDCYKQEGQETSDDFWMTREQIGQLLGYENPNDAIKIIHLRNAERLDKFSTRFKMNHVEGSRMVTREVIVYNFKGLLEICRYSNQPKAHEVIDALWEIADEIRRTGTYMSKAYKQQSGGMDPVNQIFFDQLQKISQDFSELKRDLAHREQARDCNKRISDPVALKYKQTITVAQLAVILSPEGYGNVLEQDDLFCWFREHGYVHDDPERYNQPTRFAIMNAYLSTRSELIEKEGSNELVPYIQTVVTPKGLKHFLKLRDEGEKFVYMPDEVLRYFRMKRRNS